jgi:membrane protein YdbS with pleckstrin-like domain
MPSPNGILEKPVPRVKDYGCCNLMEAFQMRCVKCGLESKSNGNFCEHCGAPRNDQGRMHATAQRPDATADSARADDPMGPGETQAPPSVSLRGIASATSHSPQPERVVWEEHPSFKTALPLLVEVLVAYLVIAVVLAATGVAARFQGYVLAAAALVIAVVAAYFLIRLYSVRYRLTTQRLFIEHGLFNKRTDELELEHYKDVFVSQEFLDRLMGCGDIEIITGDISSPTVKIVDVNDPVAKKEFIRTSARDRQIALGIVRREEL